jgi:hypothetical protein
MHTPFRERIRMPGTTSQEPKPQHECGPSLLFTCLSHDRSSYSQSPSLQLAALWLQKALLMAATSTSLAATEAQRRTFSCLRFFILVPAENTNQSSILLRKYNSRLWVKHK